MSLESFLPGYRFTAATEPATGDILVMLTSNEDGLDPDGLAGLVHDDW